MPLVIFALVAAITLLSVFTIEAGEDEREEAEVARHAQSVAAAIERRAYTSTSYLRAGAALFGSQERIDGPLFRRFVEELRLDSEYRGALGIGWAEAVAPGGFAAFEARLSEGKQVPLRIWPAGGEARPVVVPILYFHPDTLENRRAIGFDMYSEMRRRTAMDAAAQAIRPTATAPIELVGQSGEGEQGKSGFLVYMPVYDSADEGRQLKGYVYIPFNAQQFLSSAAELVAREHFPVRLYDIGGSKPELLAGLLPWAEEGLVIRRETTVANRRMMVEILSTKGAKLSPMSMITLLFGIAVASLLMLVARLLTQQAMEDSRSLAWFEQQNSIRNSLTRELNHRVKNTLANVLSIMALTRRRAKDLDSFADALDGRIRALSATHDLLTKSEWNTTPVGSVVEVEVAPYLDVDAHHFEYGGPPVELAPNDALSLGLALHELATNAAKFGALSVEGGSVRITWDLESPTLACVEWSESGGPAPSEPRRRGFGLELLEKIVAHELRHPVDLRFTEQGVRCTLRVSVREPSEFELRQGPAKLAE